MQNLFVLAETGGTNTNAMLAAFFPFVLMFVVLYMLMIRPQRKKEQERKKMIDEVKKGDKIVTIGGIYATVVSTKDEDLIIKIDPAKEVCVKLTRSGVHRVIASDQKTDGSKP